MLGIAYIMLSWIIGYNIVNRLLDKWIRKSIKKSMRNGQTKLSKWMVTLSSSFLVGMLFSTWFTYMVTWVISYMKPEIEKPLYWGNIITFTVLFLALFIFIFTSNKDFLEKVKKILKNQDGYAEVLLKTGKFEIVFVAISLIVWTTFIFRSLNVKDGILRIGVSVFSDFGATLPILRSFSLGSNFPTVYPHFVETVKGINDIRYHFFFQFMSGNLEYLGLRIDWAFNLPSILSIIALSMLLYSLALVITGKRIVGVLATILFFFRSSFAYFTYLSDLNLSGLKGIKNILNEIIFKNSSNIGKTIHEDWGFWAQKVYMNKRHFSFALGITVFALILLFPLFKDMIKKLNRYKFENQILNAGENKTTLSSPVSLVSIDIQPLEDKKLYISKFRYYFMKIVLDKDSWKHESLVRPVMIGVLLGLTSFWNGATVISVLTVMFMMAILSKHRLEYLYAAVIAVTLSLLQTKFFMGNGSGVSTDFYFGFISPDRSIMGVLKYYFELFGILPLILVFSCFNGFKGKNWLLICFIMPFLVATTFKFSVDVGANHVIIIFSIMLLSIIVADFLWQLYERKNAIDSVVILYLVTFVFVVAAFLFKFESQIFMFIIGIIVTTVATITLVLIFDIKKPLFMNLRKGMALAAIVTCFTLLTNTGFVDFFTLYNMDKNTGTQYSMKDPLIKWVSKNTSSKDTFLINPNFTHGVLMAGRSVFLGGAYFTYTAGYDYFQRNLIVKKIFEGTDINEIRKLIDSNNIKYIVIDNSLRKSKDYNLNEKIFKRNFSEVYNDDIDTTIYKSN